MFIMLIMPYYGAGSPSPLGPSSLGSGINFALYAKYAKGVELCIYDADHNITSELSLDPTKHKTGMSTWV